MGGLITSFLFGDDDDDDDDDDEEIEYAGFPKTVADPPEPEKKKGLVGSVIWGVIIHAPGRARNGYSTMKGIMAILVTTHSRTTLATW